MKFFNKMTIKFTELPKLKKGDKVAILSPSFAGPAKWPHVYQLGLKRIREIFELEPVEFPTTSLIGASKKDRSADLIKAFEDTSIKAIITSLGGSDQVTYIKNLPSEPFINNPKPFLGYSDNSHFMNHLWLNGIPSYYGGSVLTQFAMQGNMDQFTIDYIKKAIFEEGVFSLTSSDVYNDIGLNWNDPTNLDKSREYENNNGWHWDGTANSQGITWGGCVESIDEMLRHGVTIPTLEQFEKVVLFAETSEEIPSHEYVKRVFRAFGERGILERIQGVLIGRPKAWEFDKQNTLDQKSEYRKIHRETISETIRTYNKHIPIIQNMDFGHTDPQICLPMGQQIYIDSQNRTIKIKF
jgi:muramoyltetrapeptide carboxypeptidase LdcA involved in peptidoglycan recycling